MGANPTKASQVLTRPLKNHDLDAYRSLTQWYKGALGQHLLSREQHLIDELLQPRFGYHLLQLGCAELDLLAQARIEHKFTLTPFLQVERQQAVAEAEALPLATASVDCVLLHHALDYSLDQHQLLREVTRILVAGGHVVIVGFNPLSSWGIRSKLQWGETKAPWHARMLRCLRVCDWLKLLDFQIDSVRYADYVLPFNAPAAIRYSGWLEPLATRLNWPTGAVYVISARKQVLPLIPVNNRSKRRAMPVVGIPLPGSRSTQGLSQAARNSVSA